MDFLRQVYFSNTVGAYLEVIIAILIALLIKRILSKYLTRVLFKMGKGKWSGLSVEALDEKLINPIERFFMIIVVIVSLDRLIFPKELYFRIHNVSGQEILGSIAAALFIIGFAGLLIRFMDFVALVIKHRTGVKSQGEHQLLYFFKDFIKVVLIIFAIILVLKFSFKFNVSKLLTGLSIVGAALALAARESLENLIASFVIFFDKPFETGDIVKIKDVRGSVERIGLRSTRIRTDEKSLVTVPNKQMVDNILDNFSSRSLVRNEVKINIPSKYSTQKIELIISAMKTSVGNCKDVEDVEIYLQEITGDNAVAMVIYYTPIEFEIDRMNRIRQEVNIRLKEVLDQNAPSPVSE